MVPFFATTIPPLNPFDFSTESYQSSQAMRKRSISPFESEAGAGRTILEESPAFDLLLPGVELQAFKITNKHNGANREIEKMYGAGLKRMEQKNWFIKILRLR